MTMRFNPPPSWPAPPSRDWTPPPGWQPNPAWGSPPPNWPLWVDDSGPWAAHAVAAPQDMRPWYQKKRFIVPIGVGGLFIVVGVFAPSPDDPQTTTATQSIATTSTVPASKPSTAVAAKSAPTTKPAVEKLSQQQEFVKLIDDARNSANDAENNFQKRLPLTNRNKAICKLFKSKSVVGWTGEVKTLDTNGDGLGVLAVEIADGVKVSTWNNALSDYQDNTLIPTDSELFATMSGLSEGDRVTFSGSLVSDPENCIGEQSITDNGSTQTPTFTMRFSKLAKA